MMSDVSARQFRSHRALLTPFATGAVSTSFDLQFADEVASTSKFRGDSLHRLQAQHVDKRQYQSGSKIEKTLPHVHTCATKACIMNAYFHQCKRLKISLAKKSSRLEVLLGFFVAAGT